MTRPAAARFAAFALLAGLAVIAATPRPAVTSPQVAPGATTATFGIWTVHMSQVDFNQKTGDFSTPNHLTMTRSGGDISADRANGNATRKIAHLYGHVVVHDASFTSASHGLPGRGPGTLTADRLDVASAAKVYVAIGNVHYMQGETIADADQGRLDDEAHVMYLDGNVHMIQGANSMWGDHMVYNMLTGEGHAQARSGVLQFPAHSLFIAHPSPGPTTR
jgi:lipopolysaccharide assembly outer membrane protein LptD (OstA)